MIAAHLPNLVDRFGALVDGDRLQAAAATGFDEVMARSVFFRRLPSLLADHGAGRGQTG